MKNKFEEIEVNIGSLGVCEIILNRPDKHNAMNRRMIDELEEAGQYLAKLDSARVVFLQANGTTFCAGGDLNWMKDQEKKSKEGKLVEARALAKMLATMNSLPMPLISIVSGSAFGGGLGLISVSDTVIVSQNSKFGLTETRLGLIPATIGPFVIKKLGESFGRNVFFSGKIFDANLAYKMGLVHYICEDKEEIDCTSYKNETNCASENHCYWEYSGLGIQYQVSRPDDDDTTLAFPNIQSGNK